MKNKFRVLLLTCILVLSMCFPAYAEVITDEYNGTTVEQFKEYTVNMYDTFMGYSESDIEGYLSNYEGTDDPLVDSFLNLLEMKDTVADAEAGEFVIETIEDKNSDGVLSLKLDLSNDSGDYVMTLILNEEMYIIDFSFQNAQDAPKSLGESMKTAALNTVLGMGITFIMLIIISFVISLLKYLPGSGGSKNKTQKKEKNTKKATVTKSTDEEEIAAVIAAATAASQDDTELVAVISAAIAAATGTSTDSFVVRSIKKRRW